jgi:aspartyl protease family protein
MTQDQTMQIAYLSVLGIAILIGVLLQSRGRIGKVFHQGASWLFIFLGVVVGYGIWSDTSFSRMPQQSVFAKEGRIEVPRSRDGHYHLTLVINDVPVHTVVDTGATYLVLTRADSERVGLLTDELIFAGRADTANGRVETAHVKLESVVLGPIEDRFVPALVNGGEMTTSLLGMSYLSRFTRLEITENRLVLIR